MVGDVYFDGGEDGVAGIVGIRDFVGQVGLQIGRDVLILHVEGPVVCHVKMLYVPFLGLLDVHSDETMCLWTVVIEIAFNVDGKELLR